MTERCTTQMLLNIFHAKVGLPLTIPNINTASWEELGVESLGFTEVCTSLEHTFGVVIPQADAFAVQNIQELVEFVNSLSA